MKKLFKSKRIANNANEWVRINRWILFLSIFILSLIIVVYIRNVRQVNNLVLEIRRIEKQAELIENRNKVLSKEMLKLESPNRIIKIAEENLGMVRHDSTPIIIQQDKREE